MLIKNVLYSAACASALQGFFGRNPLFPQYTRTVNPAYSAAPPVVCLAGLFAAADLGAEMGVSREEMMLGSIIGVVLTALASDALVPAIGWPASKTISAAATLITFICVILAKILEYFEQPQERAAPARFVR